STKNALSISMRAQPRSGFALWTVLFPSFLLLISKYLVLQSARIFLRTSRHFVARDLILPLALDVRDKSAVEAAVASLPADYAETNILVNNAGLSSIVRFKGDENRASNVYDGTKPLTAEDIADTVHWVVTRLGHVNIDTISMIPVCQAFAGDSSG